MMYMHYCKDCHHIHILNGHKTACPKCGNPLTELRISYSEYAHMNIDNRKQLLAQCQDAAALVKLQTTYRMHKYSKWYKKMQEQ